MKLKPTKGIVLEPKKWFDKCMVSVSRKGHAVYSWDLLVQTVMDKYDLTWYDAAEYVEYNIVGLEPMGLKIKYAKKRLRS